MLSELTEPVGYGKYPGQCHVHPKNRHCKKIYLVYRLVQGERPEFTHQLLLTPVLRIRPRNFTHGCTGISGYCVQQVHVFLSPDTPFYVYIGRVFDCDDEKIGKPNYAEFPSNQASIDHCGSAARVEKGDFVHSPSDLANVKWIFNPRQSAPVSGDHHVGTPGSR